MDCMRIVQGVPLLQIRTLSIFLGWNGTPGVSSDSSHHQYAQQGSCRGQREHTLRKRADAIQGSWRIRDFRSSPDGSFRRMNALN